MKIFINNRNLYTWPKEMARLLSEQGHQVIFIDNGSTYEPLLEFYEEKLYEVHRLANLGKTAAWASGIVNDLNEYYVVTDPDYDLSKVPQDWDQVLMEGFEYFPHIIKCGLSWDESEVPQENPAYILDEFYKYPEGCDMCWGDSVKLPHNFYNYPCDTSFAIYKPQTPFTISGIRKGRPYTGTHLPWHIVLEPSADPTKRSVIMDEEIFYYFNTVENSSCTHPRLQSMLDQYKLLRNNG